MALRKYILETICDTNKQSVPPSGRTFGKVPLVTTPELCAVCLQTFDLFQWF